MSEPIDGLGSFWFLDLVIPDTVLELRVDEENTTRAVLLIREIGLASRFVITVCLLFSGNPNQPVQAVLEAIIVIE
ncbi:hypothetical protein L1987_33206 [Smallanthus sonchifolius]|uniref:Uncharacterized protein n=1 Tax=Smallanthus sonchifolius TaxID=185202 RepID=A0ACB9HRL6_9ASTR|nr:hypothetical protein L1987_33206 [Smallanthus sonchifolius]